VELTGPPSADAGEKTDTSLEATGCIDTQTAGLQLKAYFEKLPEYFRANFERFESGRVYSGVVSTVLVKQ
jgi:hypothetical protein